MERFILRALTTFGDRLQSVEERGIISTPWQMLLRRSKDRLPGTQSDTSRDSAVDREDSSNHDNDSTDRRFKTTSSTWTILLLPEIRATLQRSSSSSQRSTQKRLYVEVDRFKRISNATAQDSPMFRTSSTPTLCLEPVLRRPDCSQSLRLMTDWSQAGVGAVLSQLDEKGQEFAVAYASRSCNAREKKYCSYDGESLAVVWASRKMVATAPRV